MVVSAPKPMAAAGLRELVVEGGRRYREALAAQIRGVDPASAWERWEEATAAILIISWASGALDSARAAGVPLGDIPQPASFARDGELPLKSPILRSVETHFEAGVAQEVISRFIRMIPLTRERWESLIATAFEAASELREDEQANALTRMTDRSPDLAAIISGKVTAVGEDLPEEVIKRRTPSVQAAHAGSFFVTGMTQEQIVAAREILAKAVSGEVTVSVAGKMVETMGVGDFVAHTVLQTGTDLTAARLETVFRTNINRAQSQGRLDICRDPTVRKFVPLMRFRATKDKRTRLSHRQFDGFVATVEQIDAQGIPTPLGFNCRCTWTPIPIAIAVRDGFCDEDGRPDFQAITKHNGGRQELVNKGLVPDIGFIAG